MDTGNMVNFHDITVTLTVQDPYRVEEVSDGSQPFFDIDFSKNIQVISYWVPLVNTKYYFLDFNSSDDS